MSASDTTNIWEQTTAPSTSEDNNEEQSTTTTESSEESSYQLVNPKDATKRKIDKSQMRSIRVPANRYTALKAKWESIYTPIVEKLELQVRMNTKRKCVEIRVCYYRQFMITFFFLCLEQTITTKR